MKVDCEYIAMVNPTKDLGITRECLKLDCGDDKASKVLCSSNKWNLQYRVDSIQILLRSITFVKHQNLLMARRKTWMIGD
jgi:hypothetical protein